MREARKKAINNKSNIRKSNEEEYKNLLTELEAEIIKRNY